MLTENSAQARLDELRRQRDAIERNIVDLTLYLELGRRLALAELSGTEQSTAFRMRSGSPDVAANAGSDSVYSEYSKLKHASYAHACSLASPGSSTDGLSPGRDESSERTSARRRGRELLEAALALLDEAGRPLHAGEILKILAERGFEVAGRDPVAALNTRLWKRAVRGGRLRRLGDAVYAVSEPSGK